MCTHRQILKARRSHRSVSAPRTFWVSVYWVNQPNSRSLFIHVEICWVHYAQAILKWTLETCEIHWDTTSAGKGTTRNPSHWMVSWSIGFHHITVASASPCSTKTHLTKCDRFSMGPGGSRVHDDLVQVSSLPPVSTAQAGPHRPAPPQQYPHWWTWRFGSRPRSRWRAANPRLGRQYIYTYCSIMCIYIYKCTESYAAGARWARIIVISKLIKWSSARIIYIRV